MPGPQTAKGRSAADGRSTAEERSTGAGGEIVAVDDGYAQIAQDILSGACEGPNGVWRMPWHALEGGLPENAFSGRRFRTSNLLTLSVACKRRGFKANLWAPAEQWERKRGRIRAGETGTVILVPVFDDAAPAKRWQAGSANAPKSGPLGGDPEGGELRPLIGFTREPWFNVAQIEGLDIRPPAPPLPSQAARALLQLLADWRSTRTGLRGPALVHGGHQAFWNPACDRITSPAEAAYGDYDGLSGLEYYAAVLAHEHVHATGSRNRLKRSSLAGYSRRPERAKEEMVAELGAAFLCGRFGLGTVLRPDHGTYVRGWMENLASRDRRRDFFWAAGEAQKAADFIVAQASSIQASTSLASTGRPGAGGGGPRP